MQELSMLSTREMCNAYRLTRDETDASQAQFKSYKPHLLNLFLTLNFIVTNLE